MTKQTEMKQNTCILKSLDISEKSITIIARWRNFSINNESDINFAQPDRHRERSRTVKPSCREEISPYSPSK